MIQTVLLSLLLFHLSRRGGRMAMVKGLMVEKIEGHIIAEIFGHLFNDVLDYPNLVSTTSRPSCQNQGDLGSTHTRGR